MLGNRKISSWVRQPRTRNISIVCIHLYVKINYEVNNHEGIICGPSELRYRIRNWGRGERIDRSPGKGKYIM